METPTVKVLFVDIGNVLLTNGWDHVSRRRAAEKFALDIDDRRLFVDVARGLGIRGIHHRNYAETRAALAAEGLTLRQEQGGHYV
jgi:hypothetical protein